MRDLLNNELLAVSGGELFEQWSSETEDWLNGTFDWWGSDFDDFGTRSSKTAATKNVRTESEALEFIRELKQSMPDVDFKCTASASDPNTAAAGFAWSITCTFAIAAGSKK